MSGHTPGPWDASGLTVYDTCLDGVASTHTAADARLIAAAPDLLEACEAALATHTLSEDEAGLPSIIEVGRMLKAAIAKAKGAAQ